MGLRECSRIHSSMNGDRRPRPIANGLCNAVNIYLFVFGRSPQNCHCGNFVRLLVLDIGEMLGSRVSTMTIEKALTRVWKLLSRRVGQNTSYLDGFVENSKNISRI